MKLWISLSIFALLALMTIFFQDENHSISKPVAETPNLSTLNMVQPRTIAKPSPAKHEFFSETTPPEAEPVAKTDDRPDLLTWSKSLQPNSDEINSLQDAYQDRTDCPVLMVTYGDSPKPNMKVEQRKAGGRNFDATGCPTPSSDFLVSTDEH